MNIYQPAQSAVTGILAPVNFANTVQFICSAIQAASRENFEQSSKLCVQYLAPIIKNRQYNYPPLGFNPFVGASARPNEITYSEDRLRSAPAACRARGAAAPVGREAAPPRPRPRPTPTDPRPGSARPDAPAAGRARREARCWSRRSSSRACSRCPGCEWRGLNSLSLPGTEGSGDGSYTIQAQLPDVVVIQQNTRVRVADVNVGNVTKIEVQDWHALVTMRIDGNVHLPANSTAKVGQTSLLGSMHIELAPPDRRAAAGRAQGRLGDPAVVRRSTYPTTEQTLASVSILLNGGGLGQLQEINQTFAKALAGRENDMRSLLTQLDTFISQLNDQTDDIITATENLNSLAGQVAANDQTRRPGADHDPAGAGGAGRFAHQAGRRHRRARQVQRHRRLDGRPDQGIAGGQPAQHRAGVAVAGRRRARAHQGPGLPVHLSVGEEHRSPTGSAATSPTSRLVVDLTLSRHRQQPVHRDAVGGQPHRTRTAVGPHDRPDAEPVHRGQPADRPLPLRGCTDMLRLSRTVWTQLAILAAVTLIAVRHHGVRLRQRARAARHRPIHGDASTCLRPAGCTRRRW